MKMSRGLGKRRVRKSGGPRLGCRLDNGGLVCETTSIRQSIRKRDEHRLTSCPPCPKKMNPQARILIIGCSITVCWEGESIYRCV